MKIRTSFVTNSSSSSYIVIYSVNDSPEIRDFVKEEFGNYGIRDYEGSMLNGKDLREHLCDWYGYDDLDDFDDSLDEKLIDDQKYLYGSIVSYTTEGDSTDSIFTIIDHLPEGTCTLVYEGEDY